ncbi:hypothetical protein [Variovorax paradoxus]|uniref:hypothetical protein n=1 Tax=Variovorax paradoxus TaxID=34073 RepID=UPI003ECDFDD3
MSLGDWPQPLDGCRLGRQRSQPFVAPQIARNILQLKRVDGMPLLLQPVRAGGNPKGCGHVFHVHIILYIYPVLCDVYILYESGEPRPEGEAKAHPIRGWLCYGDAGRSYPHEEAHLYRSRTDPTEIAPFVDYARVKKIKRGGLRIEGLQEHGYREHWRQVWWCLPVVPEEQTAGN